MNEKQRTYLMSYTVAKRNVGPVRTFQTKGGLERLLKRHGASRVEWRPDGREIAVEWPEGLCKYAIEADGTIEEQLAWDL